MIVPGRMQQGLPAYGRNSLGVFSTWRQWAPIIDLAADTHTHTPEPDTYPFVLLNPPVAGGQVFLVTDTDKILLADLRSSIFNKHIPETVFVRDAIARVQERILADTVLVNDRRFSVVDRQFIESVLVADRVLKTLDKIVLDRLLVVDIATIQQIVPSFERTVVDGLYMLDRIIRTEEHVSRDSVFLQDAVIRELLRTLVDGMVLRDVRAAEVFLTTQDRILLSDLSQRMREMLIHDGLEVIDAILTAIQQAVITVLVYDRVRAQDPLGIDLLTRDVLGRRIRAADWMGISIGIRRKPDVH